MNTVINAKQLRASLPEIVRRVRKGARFTVLYRSSPAFQIVPADEAGQAEVVLEADTLYQAKPVGRSTDRRTAADHDEDLYGE
jgi:antitoxin (DNA-binding transcriptional repressor) of toxin-antitoxin stability system